MIDQKPTVLVTGAYGFVGQVLCRHLLDQGYRVIGWVRKLQSQGSLERVDYRPVGDLDSLSVSQLESEIRSAGIKKVVHLAARVHQMKEASEGKRDRYFKINRDFSVRLHQAAQNEKVETFIFMSTVKVMGENSTFEMDETTPPHPQDDYADSKLAAEEALLAQSQPGTKTYVFRIPLIFGQAAKGNFKILVKAIDGGLPLPLASIHNCRSMLYVENLCSAIERAISQNQASSGVYFITDDARWSTSQLIRSIGRALGKKIVLLPFPPKFLHLLASAVGKGNYTSRLTDSFYFSSQKFREQFQWLPPIQPDESLKRTLSDATR